MEQTFVHIADTAAWVFFILILFAIIGVYATIRWIINLVTAGERAVESGVQSVEDKLSGH
ncbi:MAG TPA: hypothetical protein VMD47_07360 [Candidatus Acidoferrales bacterium]|nr:hypothetical protein [Candidatus Acidoferrales bacterium]